MGQMQGELDLLNAYVDMLMLTLVVANFAVMFYCAGEQPVARLQPEPLEQLIAASATAEPLHIMCPNAPPKKPSPHLTC